MTRDDCERLGAELAVATKIFVRREVSKTLTRVVELESQLKALANRPQLEYMGIWKAGPYAMHAAVTHHGSLWIARTATTREPRTVDSGWQLAAKKGKDGRDGRDSAK